MHHAIATFITEVLHLVIYVQPFNDYYSKSNGLYHASLLLLDWFLQLALFLSPCLLTTLITAAI